MDYPLIPVARPRPLRRVRTANLLISLLLASAVFAPVILLGSAAEADQNVVANDIIDSAVTTIATDREVRQG